MKRGKFITLEGGEGAGKSTQGHILVQRLEAKGHRARLTREPGGAPLAERIRQLLLDPSAGERTALSEALLFSAARADHIAHTIEPALAEGIWVISDRFADSTRAYQGAASRLDMDTVLMLERVVVGATRPDLTLMLDLPAEIGLERAALRLAAAGGERDRFERADIAFHQRLRAAFLAIARGEPSRCAVVDASTPADETADAIWAVVTTRLAP